MMRVSTAPHIHSGATTRRVMVDVLISLVPCVVAGVYRFGYRAAILLAISMLACLVCEYLWQKLTKRSVTVGDCSALVTGLLLGLNIPVDAPFWLPIIGAIVAILIAKQLFGGIGDNFINPALAARAVLLTSWPVYMTTFSLPVNNVLAADAVSTATPLVTQSATYMQLLTGDIPGSIGEVSKLMILLGLAYLLITKVISWRIPIVMLGTVALFTWIFGGDPLYAVMAGGVMFGAVFMATDYTTSPMTATGQYIYAAAAGLIVVVIRQFGAYPEGVTYAILLANVLTPLIDKYVKPRVFGHEKKKEAHA